MYTTVLNLITRAYYLIWLHGIHLWNKEIQIKHPEDCEVVMSTSNQLSVDIWTDSITSNIYYRLNKRLKSYDIICYLYISIFATFTMIILLQPERNVYFFKYVFYVHILTKWWFNDQTFTRTCTQHVSKS